jgi:dihydroorotate dehydrogenase
VIKLTNGHRFEYMVASGALGFNGQGWLWEWPLVKFGLIRPELFTVVLKSLTLKPRKGNLSWWHPWTCVRPIEGGAVNKVGLTNRGIEDWCNCVGPYILYDEYPVVGSIFGNEAELVEMAPMLDGFKFKALEINYSCPNSGHALETTDEIVTAVKAVSKVTRHPLIVKLSADQECVAIARALRGVADAVSLNSVKWEIVFKDRRSPLWRLEQKVGGGGGGVSGIPAQAHNWPMVEKLVRDRKEGLPVIAPSVMSRLNVRRARALGADAVSFGAIHLRTPWKPTQIVLKEKRENRLC